MNNTIPIWRDYYLSTEEEGEFTIKRDTTGGEILYVGNAVIAPGADYADINITDIVYNYLDSSISLFNTTGSTQLNPQYILPIVVSMPDGEEYHLVYRDDYSYVNNLPIPTTNCTSYPINGKLHPKQYFVCSWFNNAEVEDVSLHLDNVVRDIHSNMLNYGQNYCIALKNYNYSNISLQFTGGTVNYRVDKCSRSNYVLYYRNGYGGWDSFIIEGNVQRTDKLSVNNFKRQYSNVKTAGNKQQRNNINYLNIIQPTYRMYTHYMSDEESLKMRHLLESNDVYLHELDTDMIMPVNITDKSVVYQTYTNNGKQLNQYTINVETSQREFRR